MTSYGKTKGTDNGIVFSSKCERFWDALRILDDFEQG
jgi:hypothetical protein